MVDVIGFLPSEVPFFVGSCIVTDLNILGIIISYTAKLSPQPHDAVALGFITFKYEPPSSVT